MKTPLQIYNSRVQEIIDAYNADTSDAREIFETETLMQRLKRDSDLQDAANAYHARCDKEDYFNRERRKDLYIDLMITVLVASAICFAFFPRI